MDANAASEAARQLIAARRGELIAGLREPLLPLSDADGYQIQDQISPPDTLLGGWKLAAGPVPACGPIPARDFHPNGTVLPRDFRPQLQVEIELGLVLARDLDPSGQGLDVADIEAAIAGATICIELLGSAYIDRTRTTRPEALADLQGNVGVVVGAPLLKLNDLDFTGLTMDATVNGEPAGVPNAPATRDAVLSAVAFLAHHAAARGRVLSAGHTIITGARIRPFAIKPGDEIVVSMRDGAEARLGWSA